MELEAECEIGPQTGTVRIGGTALAPRDRETGTDVRSGDLFILRESPQDIEAADVEPLVRQVVFHVPQVPSAFDYASLREARAAFEREYIGRKLRERAWNVSKTADDLKIERSHLHRKIKLLGIEVRPES